MKELSELAEDVGRAGREASRYRESNRVLTRLPVRTFRKFKLRERGTLGGVVKLVLILCQCN